MNLQNRIKLAVGLNLLYIIFVYLEITVISLLSYFLFMSLIFLTARNALSKSGRLTFRYNKSEDQEFVSRDKIECLFRQVYALLNHFISYFYSSTNLRNLEKLLFVMSAYFQVGGCLVGLIFLSSIFSDFSVIWIVGNVYLIWPVVSHKFEAQMEAGFKQAQNKFEEVKHKAIAVIPKFSDLQKED